MKKMKYVIKKMKQNYKDHDCKFSLFNLCHTKECDDCVNPERGFSCLCDSCRYHLFAIDDDNNKNLAIQLITRS